MTLRTVALLVLTMSASATSWGQTRTLPLPGQPVEPRENTELRISDDERAPYRMISHGTTEIQLQALLGTPTLVSTIPTTHETRLVYQDGTEVLLLDGRVVAVVLRGDAQSDYSGGYTIKHDQRQLYIDPAVVRDADHLLVSAAASPGIDTEYLHFGHPAYRSTTDPFPLGKGPHDPQWANYPDLSPDPNLAIYDTCLAECAPPEIRFLCLDVAARTWLSYAQAKESRRTGAVDVRSELKWRNMVSEVFEINARARWFECLITRFDVGIGDVSGGRFRDQVFDASGRQDLISERLRPAFDDDLFFANGELGWRLVKHANLSLDGLVGYQYWRERYISEGGIVVVPAPANLPADPVIAEEFSWDGFRIGVEGMWYATPHWTFSSRLMLMPLPHFELQNINGRRITRADGGIGVMTDILASYTLRDWLLLDIGYRLWHVNSSDGDIISPPSSRQLFNGAEMTRHGLILGLTLHF